MPEAATLVPARKPNLVIRPFGAEGEFVVKNPAKGSYLRLGAQEHFLLLQLDGARSEADVLRAFNEQFHDPLSASDFQAFVKLAERRELLAGTRPADAATTVADDDEDDDVPLEAGTKSKQSWLYFRYSFFDPNRLFDWLAPKVAVFWTRGFVVAAAIAIVWAGLTAWTNRADLSTAFGKALRWETVVLVWFVTVVVTTLHEFAHGLTCKRYGGEVHEVGLLVMFFTPCFYCNVSDAWLIPEKSKRLWITAAGGFCDLCLWAVAVFVWRVTQQDTLFNYVAYVVLSVCGVRVLFNLNPLAKLDGYYLLSDWLEIPNLRRLSHDRWMSFVRSFLWGAPRPTPVAKGRTLIVYGATVWCFYVAFLDMMYIGLCRWLGERWGIVGFLAATYLALLIVRRIFKGFFGGEFIAMLKTRRPRAVLWGVGIIVVALGACVLRMEHRAAGAFTVKPGKRVEVRAPVAGFLRAINYEQGERLAADALIGRLEIPDLESQIAQKAAQKRESEANLRRLLAGPRPEEVREQRLKVERSRAWRDLGEQDLRRAKQALNEELARVDQQIAQARAEFDYAAVSLKQAEQLYNRGVMAGQQFLSERKRYDVALMQLQQGQAQRRAREAAGTLEAEAEAARRAKDLADVEATLKLLEAGSRPEEIDAEKARLARLDEELAYLLDTRGKLEIHSPLGGTLTTERMKEKVGQYFEKGALICVIEDAAGLEAELSLPEQEVEGVKPGQIVELKARAMPFRTFTAKVVRVAPRAEKEQGALQGNVSVLCSLDHDDAGLLAGMTGMGRVSRGQLPVATVCTQSALRYLRTEFWW